MDKIIKPLLIITILVSTLQAKENEWMKSVMGLIPYGWELNKTSCKKIKRKLIFYEKQEKYYLYGDRKDIYAWCSKKNKKLKLVRFFNNKYFIKVGLDKEKGDLFLQSSKYYNKQDDDFNIDYFKDGKVYSHVLYHGENIKIIITDDSLTIKFDDSDF